MENIMEEEKHFDSGEDNGALGEQLKISDEQERTILCSKSHIWIQIVQIKNQLQKMKTDSTGQSDKQNKLETQLKNLWQNYQHFKMKMSYWGSEQTLSKPINVDYQSPQSIDPNDRWNLYFYWMNLYKDFVEKKFLELRYEHRQLSQKIIEIRNMLDLEIMKRSLVLGMTFTSLARLQATLQSLNCRIVVVEEACTVSESQIVVSLTKHCENLILLGNHQELRPTVCKSSYSLGSNVMERMIRNGLQSHSLRVQHRIRPEIVELLVPLNYPELENHHSVTKFLPVLGIPSCNYFVHHEHQDDEEYNSKTNLYEATFLVNLARYLMHVGYQPEDITILASYSGQMETLHDESEKHEDLLKSVRICTLDSYPSEECKIVLLSLVRNNADGKIGRLGFEDFVISALSQAKEALYMMVVKTMSNDRPENLPNSRLSTSNDALWKLEDLIALNSKNASSIIIELNGKLDDFSQLLTSNLERNCIILIISILAKVCSSCFRETKLAVLKIATSVSFLQTLEKFVRILKDEEEENRERNNHFWNNPQEFLVNLLFVCESLIDLLPNNYCDVLHKLLTAIESIPCSREETDSEEMQKTKSDIKMLIEKLGFRKEHHEQAIGTLSIYPTREEILTLNFGRSSKNFVEGKYDTVKVYLDVQEKLFREGFAVALRKNIVQCIEHVKGGNSDIKCSTIRMYPNVVFGTMVFNYDYWRTGVIVNFSDGEDFEEIFSPNSRRLKNGSVVCFTKDNFGTIFFGNVVNKDSRRRCLIIGFDLEDINYEANVLYTMVEINMYKNPYYDILKALPCMSEDDFPLRSYLVDAVPELEPPSYLNRTSSICLGQGSKVDVFGSNWPSADELNLDFTQYSAFRAALIQKLVMIQGAPGTGKTYLGLQIVKTLLHEENQKLWYNGTPILIVCSSKQALDHFLEGLISTTSRIIRTGGCKNDKLKNFTLKSARRSRPNRHVPLLWNRKIRGLLKQLKQYQECLNQINNIDNIIINFSNFEDIDENIKTSWFFRASNADLLAWLFDEQNQDLHSLEISEILKNITEEQKQVGISEEEIAAFEEQQNISDDPAQTILWSKSHVWIKIVQIKNQLQKGETGSSNQNELEIQLKSLRTNYQYFKTKMSLRGSMSKPINVDYQSPENMDPNDRWKFYFYLINLYKDFLEEKLLELQYEHRELYRKIFEFRSMLDLELMKEALVLGMTFTGFARSQATLQSLKCRIVVVEEACTVSESHIVVSLTKHCENLILLGSHEQLDRDADDATISLGINMTERMIRNGMECQVLGVQHRIRPEIAELLTPLNYPELENRHSVTTFPSVLGMPTFNYFIHHENPDVEKYDTHVNMYEASFLINLAVYLRKLGNEAEDITILSTYYGQTELLCNESKRHKRSLKGVRICTVNKYQGEESKIVLLSLVRNNTNGKIGRLDFEKFVIFALSRAKESLYMMGNINLLCENSKLWRGIKEVLVKQNCVGSSLPVCCKLNPDHVTQIKEPTDFKEVGGKVCSKICGRLLNCGHCCSKICHILEDDDHTATDCTELCSNRDDADGTN